MHTVEIAGLPHRSKLPARYTMPGSWEECTPEQLAQVVLTVDAHQPKEEHDEVMRELLAVQCRLQLFALLTEMPAELMQHLRDAGDLVYDTDEGPRLLPQLDWCTTERVWVQSLLPVIEHRGQRWHGPEDGLQNFSVRRWGYADWCLQGLASDPAKGLNELMGALYCAEGEEWTRDTISARGQRLASLPDATKLAALENYRAMRTWLGRRFAKAFRGGGKSDPFGIEGLIVDVAGDKFGDVDQAAEKGVQQVLIHAVHVAEDREESERRQAEMK